MSDLSVIILNYNTKDLTLACLKQAVNSQLKDYSVEIIIVDNASTDGSKDLFSKQITKLTQKNQQINKITLLENHKNLGFAAGNNRGIRQARGKYILLLNSDVFLYPNTLAKMISFMDQHPQYAASTCRLLMPRRNSELYQLPIAQIVQKLDDTPFIHKNTQLDPASHRGEPTLWASFTYFTYLEKILPRTKLFGQYHQAWKNLNQTHSVDAISGGFFFVRKAILDQVGLLDEGFFMYAEDLDLCKRIRDNDGKIAFYPKTQALHLKGMSGTKHQRTQTKQQAKQHFWQTMQLYVDKHYSDQYPRLLLWIVKKVIAYKAR